jgi:TatD DNase family protein
LSRFFDTHCHLNHHAFEDDLENVLTRAADSGVAYILVPGWDLDSSRKAIDLAEKHSQIVATVGIHPEELLKNLVQPIDEIHKLSLHPRVVAIGEIGLDYYHDPLQIEEQKQLLKQMLEIATDTKKKVILHSRESMPEIKGLMIAWSNELRAAGNPLAACPGIFHSFEGTLKDAQELLPYGYKFGVGGPLTYKNSLQKKEVFTALSVDSICLETDAPYLSPSKHRGERNEPAFLPLVLSHLADLRVQPEEVLGKQIFDIGYKMFIEDAEN